MSVSSKVRSAIQFVDAGQLPEEKPRLIRLTNDYHNDIDEEVAKQEHPSPPLEPEDSAESQGTGGIEPGVPSQEEVDPWAITPKLEERGQRIVEKWKAKVARIESARPFHQPSRERGEFDRWIDAGNYIPIYRTPSGIEFTVHPDYDSRIDD